MVMREAIDRLFSIETDVQVHARRKQHVTVLVVIVVVVVVVSGGADGGDGRRRYFFSVSYFAFEAVRTNYQHG